MVVLFPSTGTLHESMELCFHLLCTHLSSYYTVGTLRAWIVLFLPLSPKHTPDMEEIGHNACKALFPRPAKLFCKGTESKYSRLCRPRPHSVIAAELYHCSPTAAAENTQTCKHVGVAVFSYTLFIKTGGRSFLAVVHNLPIPTPYNPQSHPCHFSGLISYH